MASAGAVLLLGMLLGGSGVLLLCACYTWSSLYVRAQGSAHEAHKAGDDDLGAVHADEMLREISTARLTLVPEFTAHLERLESYFGERDARTSARRAACAELIGGPFATEGSRRWSTSSAVRRAAAFARGSSTSSAARARSSSDSTMFSCAAGSDIVDADSAVSPDKRCLDLRPAPSPGGRSESTARADKVDLTITPGDVRLRRILSC